MSKRVAVLLSAAALLLGTPLQAQTTMAMPEGKAWQHPGSSLKIPAQVGSFARTKGSDFGTTQSDVSFTYRDETSGTIATLYVFRAGLPDVSIWTERAENSIISVAPQSYGKIEKAGRRWSALSLWPNSPGGALRVIYPISGKDLKATGLLIARHGDWLIKLRISSFALDAAGLETAMTDFVTGLALPAPRIGGAPAYAVQPCADALPSAEARLVPAADNSVILASALLSIGQESGGKSGKRPEPAAVYCRDAASTGNYGVYRPNGSQQSYVLAAGDGGVTFMIAPDPLFEGLKTNEDQHTLTLRTSDRVIGFTPYLGLPSPSQAYAALKQSKPTFIQSRLPGKQEVQILVPGGPK